MPFVLGVPLPWMIQQQMMLTGTLCLQLLVYYLVPPIESLLSYEYSAKLVQSGIPSATEYKVVKEENAVH